VRGRGAAVTYLSHNASFHSKEQIEPSIRGIKHLRLLRLEREFAELDFIILGFVLGSGCARRRQIAQAHDPLGRVPGLAAMSAV
jgi:hypothetical protein